MEPRMNAESQEIQKLQNQQETQNDPSSPESQNTSSSSKPQKKLRKGIGMLAVVLLSIGLSLIVNGVYLGIETACVKAGKKMPYEKIVYGGDCYECRGVYWSILHLVPMSPVDKPIAPSIPKASFSFVKFGILTLALAFLLWIILSLVNRYFKPVIVVVGSVSIISLSIFGYKKVRASWEKTPDHLIAVTIITADVHPGVTSAMRLPGGTLTLAAPGEAGAYGYLKKEKLTDAIDPATIRGNDLKTLISATKELEEHSNPNKKDGFAYFVRVEYAKKKGIGQTYVFGYGDVPAEWSDYIHTVNQILQTDYIREEPEIGHLTGEWFTETYGVTENDLPEGKSVDDFLTEYRLEMQNACGMNNQWRPFEFRAEKVLEDYLSGQASS